MAFSSLFNKAASWSHLFRFPSNMKPNRVKMVQTPSRTDVFHTSKRTSTHGHSVIKGSSLDYSRTQGGNVVVNKPSGGGVCTCGRSKG
jgi:hypothetical protein